MKQSISNEEVSCAEPSLSVRVPWLELSTQWKAADEPGKTKVGGIAVLLTSCLTGLD
jgi:hypothetical protein